MILCKHLYWYNLLLISAFLLLGAALYYGPALEEISLPPQSSIEEERRNCHKELWLTHNDTRQQISLRAPIVFTRATREGHKLRVTEECINPLFQWGQWEIQAKLGNLTPESIILQGDVFFTENETHALGDRLFCSPKEKSAHLFGKAGERALYWDESMEISAEEVVLREGRVEGIGSVQGSFSREEQAWIDEFITRLQ